MDRRYYYRILGIREDADSAQIKAAYDKHMRRLALPDYADDPQYVARKKDQIRHAYSVLMGGARPATKAQKEAHFEKWKDAEDAGEDGVEKLKKKFERHVKDCEPEAEFSASVEDLKSMIGGVLERVQSGSAFENTSGERSGSRTKKTMHLPGTERRSSSDENRSAKLAKIIVTCTIGLSIFSSVITACGSMIVNFADEVVGDLTMGTPEYSVQEMTPAADLSEDAVNWMDHIVKNCHLYDFYGNLDLSVQNEFQDQVEWEPGDETAGEIWSEMTDMAYYLGIYSNADLVWYLTGDENFYWETDDFGNAAIMTLLMNPPEYEEIAGGINLYRDEVILDYADYLRFLADVAKAQTEDIMGPVPEY